jgi:hypothetical protein
VIHITGTKGKGSTSAFVERICRERFIEKGYFGDNGVSKLRNKEEEGDDDVVEGGDEEWYGGIGESRDFPVTGRLTRFVCRSVHLAPPLCRP